MSTTKNPVDTSYSMGCPCGEPEEWRPIARMPMYEISNHGRIRKYITGTLHMRGRYKEKYLAKHDRVHIHVLVAETFIGPRPPIPGTRKFMEVNHKDNNGLNNHLSNLEYVTHQENLLHAIRNGYHKYGKGENSTRWKITDKQREEIVELRRAGHSYQKIADLMGVAKHNVSYTVANAIADGVLTSQKARWGNRAATGKRRTA